MVPKSIHCVSGHLDLHMGDNLLSEEILGRGLVLMALGRRKTLLNSAKANGNKAANQPRRLHDINRPHSC
jgi:hypothetical protein